jgi:hypothetical protein
MIRGYLGAALHAEAGERHRYVVLHRLLRNKQPLADLPVGEALPDQLTVAYYECCRGPTAPLQETSGTPISRHILSKADDGISI